MKLEINQFIRTKSGKIARIIDKIDNSGSIHESNIVYKLDDDSLLALNSKKVKNASYNIIDLIEKHDLIKHDILHTLEVKQIDKENGIIYFFNLSWKLNIKDLQKAFELNTIKILTHEQFENNCYKIGDE